MKPETIRAVAIFVLGMLLLCVLFAILGNWKRSWWTFAAYALPSLLLLWWLLMGIGNAEALGQAYPSAGNLIKVGRKTGNVFMLTGGWAGLAGPVLLCAAAFLDAYY